MIANYLCLFTFAEFKATGGPNSSFPGVEFADLCRAAEVHEG